MKILLTILILSFGSILNTLQAGDDILGLILFANPIKSHIDLKNQKLKMVNEKKGQYYVTGRLERIEHQLRGFECDFKNKYFPSSKSQKLLLDYSGTRTYHKVFKFKFEDLQTLKQTYEEALEVLKTKYRFSGMMQGQNYAEIKDSKMRLSQKIKNNVEVIGKRFCKSQSQMDKYFIEISIESEPKELIVKVIDYRSVR